MNGGVMITTMAIGPTSHGIGTHGRILGMVKLIILLKKKILLKIQRYKNLFKLRKKLKP